MPVVTSMGETIFNEYSSAINKCRRRLAEQDWFGDGWWVNARFGGKGFDFQMSKTHWFNHNTQGIHIEFWIHEREHENKILPIVLHFERDTPRRDSLGENFEKAFSKIAAGLSDYKVGHGNLCDKLQKHEKFTKSNLDKIVVREFAKLQRAGPIIDKILSGLPQGGSQRCTECGGRAGQNRSCRTCLDYTDV